MTSVKTFMFQVHRCVTPHLCATCVLTAQGQVSLCHRESDPVPLSSSSLPPLPSADHLSVVCVCESVCVFCLFIYCFLLYISNVSEITWFLSFPSGLILLSMILSRSTHVVTDGSISSFPVAEECSIVYTHHVLYRRALQLSPCLGHHDEYFSEHRGAYIL